MDKSNFPEEINGWKHRSPNSNSYQKGNKVALIMEGKLTIGTASPAGAKLFEAKINSPEEAFEILKSK